MHTKRKAVAKRSFSADHPLTWGTIKAAVITVAAIVAALASIYGTTTLWLDGRYEAKGDAKQNKMDADAKFTEVVGRFTLQIDKLEAKLTEISKGAQRNIAWLFVGQVSQDAKTTRNRVNDCNAKEADHTLKASERPACMQYRDELTELQIKLRETTKTAQDASK